MVGPTHSLFHSPQYPKCYNQCFLVIGVARILSAGVHFFTTQQKLLKIDSCSGWGCTSCPAGVHLHIFSCKLGLKKIFTALGGVQVHPLHPPGYAYVFSYLLQQTQIIDGQWAGLIIRCTCSLGRRSIGLASSSHKNSYKISCKSVINLLSIINYYS